MKQQLLEKGRIMDTSTWLLPVSLTPARYLAGMITEYTVCTIMIFLVLDSIRLYLQKKNGTTIKITFVFCGFFIATMLTATGKMLVISGLLTYPIVEYHYFLDAFAFMSLLISNTAFFLFTLDVFYTLHPSRKRIVVGVYLAFEALVGVIGGIVIGSEYAGVPQAQLLGLNMLLDGMIFGFSVFTYLLLAIRALAVAKRASGADRVFMRMIGLSGVFVIAFILAFVSDVLNLFGLGNISVPYFIAWSFAVAAVFITRIGYFRPPWFIRRFISPAAQASTAS